MSRATTIGLALAALGAAACSIETTYEDVRPILAARCGACHEGGVSTFRPYFTDYESVAGLERRLRDAVTSRKMPPFGVDNTTTCGNNYFADQGLWLSDLELQTLTDWVDDGVPRGDPHAEPSPPARSTEPVLAHVDRTIAMTRGYTFSGFDPDSQHRCFVTDPEIDHAAFLAGYEVQPGNRFAVQSVALHALDGDDARAAAAALDDEDDQPGYPCFGGARVDGARFLGSWVWGSGAVRFPEGTGVRLEPGSHLVIQVHYNSQGGSLHPAEDRTGVALELVDQATEATYTILSADGFSLRPGDKDAVARGHIEIDRAIAVLGVAPLMHESGVELQVSRVRPFSRTCMAMVTHWELYNHLRLFQYATAPPEVFPGDRLEIECRFETLNRLEPTRQGQDPSNEQCLARLLVVER